MEIGEYRIQKTLSAWRIMWCYGWHEKFLCRRVNINGNIVPMRRFRPSIGHTLVKYVDGRVSNLFTNGMVSTRRRVKSGFEYKMNDRKFTRIEWDAR